MNSGKNPPFHFPCTAQNVLIRTNIIIDLPFSKVTPLSIYLKKRKIKLLNAKDSQYYFQLAIALVYNLDSKKKKHKELLNKWTSRSLCAGETVILFKKGFFQQQLMILLHWNFNAYSCYLHNLPQLDNNKTTYFMYIAIYIQWLRYNTAYFSTARWAIRHCLSTQYITIFTIPYYGFTYCTIIHSKYYSTPIEPSYSYHCWLQLMLTPMAYLSYIYNIHDVFIIKYNMQFMFEVVPRDSLQVSCREFWLY